MGAYNTNGGYNSRHFGGWGLKDDYNQTTRQIREQRNKVSIAVFPISGLSASCKICNQRYISLENNTILWCKNCGDRRLASQTKHSDYCVRA